MSKCTKAFIWAGLLLVWPACTLSQAVHVTNTDAVVSLSNERVQFTLDKRQGQYSILDLRAQTVCIYGAHVELNGWRSDGPGVVHRVTSRHLYDGLGKGTGLLIESHLPEGPVLLLDVAIYAHRGFVCLNAGLNNTMEQPIPLVRLAPLTGAVVFPGQIMTDLALLDGNGGGEDTSVTRSAYLACRNNGLLTFQQAGRRRSLVLGGLTYHDYEKFVRIGLSRAETFRQSRDQITYLDLGEAASASSENGIDLRLIQGRPYRFGGIEGAYPPELKSVVFDENEVKVEARGLRSGQHYRVSVTWWDVDGNGRVQSVWLEEASGIRTCLLPKQALPAWRTQQQGPVQIDLPLLSQNAGPIRLISVNEAPVPNAVVSEVWIKSVDDSPPVQQHTVTLAGSAAVKNLPVALFAEDPVGHRVDPGIRYMPDDRFYVDVTTDDPFDALETYVQQVRTAQAINLTPYDFPTVCLWYAELSPYGGGPSVNHSVGAVEEMQRIKDSGFLAYARAAVRLVPDYYEANNQQGWWDNEHFAVARPEGSQNGRYLPPFETTEKWAGAVQALGGLPLTYCQTGFRSEDYAQTYPEHMLFNEAVHLRQHAQGKDPTGLDAWQRNDMVWGYDYTDPGFMAHMRDVYDTLRRGGVQGLMFDYAYTGWASEGGFEDPYATTASAYRNIFRLAREGLGSQAYLHERNLARGSDVTLGLVSSQRLWGDTDQITPEMIARGALRWYKNRVVVNYDMDAKCLHKTSPRTRDARRRLLTMAYVTSARFLMGNSFAKLTSEMFHDVTRVFPFHSIPRSARPVDALIRRVPQIYDFPVNKGWHQVTLYNPQDQNAMTVTVPLSKDPAAGGLGLNPQATYHAYDFWNDTYLGTLSGAETLTQTLRPAEARMISLRQKQTVPQVLGTNRHLMQGLVELKDVRWDQDACILQGMIRVAAQDPTVIQFADNGAQVESCVVENAQATLEYTDTVGQLRILSEQTQWVPWRISFQH
ncbi:MAG: hypothetical protein K9N55_17915 [Phycisphaerae bacterium]|nr:hypothetical protein [Phycisphaerae bacterium]